MIEEILPTLVFYLFSVLLIGASVAVITLRNPVHSVLFLIFAFFNAAGLFVLLGAEFLAMLLVIVYVGAVAVLFLFVVMMLNVSVERFRDGLTKYYIPGLALAAIILLELILVFYAKGESLVAVQGFEAAPHGVSNTEALGRLIYTDYIFLFQTSGLVLLVAMIGAIVLTYSKRDRMRKQVIGKQVTQDSKRTVTLTNPESGKGVS